MWLMLGYVVLTVLYGQFGYLDNLDDRVRGHDSVYYYSYLRSVVIDGDLDFGNEFDHFYHDRSRRPYEDNVFSIGPAILWSPFFLAAHVATVVARVAGSSLAADGYSSFYQAAVYVANSFYGLVGLLFCASLLRTYVSSRATLCGCLVILFASPLTYYLWSLTVMSHNVSFATTSFFLFMFVREGPTKRSALTAALMILARWQNALFLLLVAVQAVVELNKAGRLRSIPSIVQWLKTHGTFSLVLGLGLLPQFLVWERLFGEYVLIPQGSTFLSFTSPAILSVVVGLRHGLFAWHPALIFGCVGLLLLWKPNRLHAISFLAVFAGQWLLNASVTDWWAGWSFGHRRFISLLPVLGLGVSVTVEYVLSRWAVKKAVVSLIALVGIWNQLFVFQYMNGLIPRSISPSIREVWLDKFDLIALSRAMVHLNNAWTHSQADDVRGFVEQATIAYRLRPRLRGVATAYGLACVLGNNLNDGNEFYAEWLAEAPDDALRKWGRAELLVRDGRFDQAAALYRRPSGELETRILRQIIERRNSLVDREFAEMFAERIRSEKNE